MTISSRRLRRAAVRAIPSYLVVATSADLADVRLTLQTLPICAHGRVLIVAAPDDEVPSLELPPRIGATVLRAPQGVAAHEAARRAVEAWASEMLCDAADAATPPQVWLAGDAEQWAPLSQSLVQHHGLPAASLRLGSGFGAA